MHRNVASAFSCVRWSSSAMRWMKGSSGRGERGSDTYNGLAIFKQYELTGRSWVLIFLGEVPDNPAQWRTSPSFVNDTSREATCSWRVCRTSAPSSVNRQPRTSYTSTGEIASRSRVFLHVSPGGHSLFERNPALAHSRYMCSLFVSVPDLANADSNCSDSFFRPIEAKRPLLEVTVA